MDRLKRESIEGSSLDGLDSWTQKRAAIRRISFCAIGHLARVAVKLADSENGQSGTWARDERGKEEEQIIITCPCHLERVRGELGSDPMAAIPKNLGLSVSLFSGGPTGAGREGPQPGGACPLIIIIIPVGPRDRN